MNSRMMTLVLVALALAAGAANHSARGADDVPAPPKVVHDWPEYRGPNGQFGDTSKVPLADSMAAMTLLWESEKQTGTVIIFRHPADRKYVDGMPRAARVVVPGSAHQVTQRGNPGAPNSGHMI